MIATTTTTLTTADIVSIVLPLFLAIVGGIWRILQKLAEYQLQHKQLMDDLKQRTSETTTSVKELKTNA